MKAYSIVLCLLGISTAFSDQSNSIFSTKDLRSQDSTNTKKEDPSVVVREHTVGNVKVTATAKNIDEASQFRNECKPKHKKRKSEQSKDTDKDKEEDHSPQVSLNFKWPAR